jgi:hypothetical protein
MICYAEQVIVNHGELWWASDCESWFVMLSECLCIMVFFAEPVAVNDGVFYWASGRESWCDMMNQWLWNG